MGIFSNKTVTIYNRYVDEENGYDVYVPTVLTGTNLVETAGHNISSSGLTDADTAKLFIDYETLYANTKQYVDPKSYEKATSKTNLFTIAEGDFFVKGDTSSVTVQQYAFYEYMRENYSSVYKVTNIDYYEDIMPHIEVGGK